MTFEFDWQNAKLRVEENKRSVGRCYLKIEIPFRYSKPVERVNNITISCSIPWSFTIEAYLNDIYLGTFIPKEVEIKREIPMIPAKSITDARDSSLFEGKNVIEGRLIVELCLDDRIVEKIEELGADEKKVEIENNT